MRSNWDPLVCGARWIRKAAATTRSRKSASFIAAPDDFFGAPEWDFISRKRTLHSEEQKVPPGVTMTHDLQRSFRHWLQAETDGWSWWFAQVFDAIRVPYPEYGYRNIGYFGIFR